eukprot:scaffold133570_cov48-Attheya_sp.AAC.1
MTGLKQHVTYRYDNRGKEVDVGVVGVVGKRIKCNKMVKRTTPGIPTWSPTVVLTGPEDA